MWSAVHTLVTSTTVPLMRVGSLPVVPSPITERSTVRKCLLHFQSVRRQVGQSTIPVWCDEGVFVRKKQPFGQSFKQSVSHPAIWSVSQTTSLPISHTGSQSNNESTNQLCRQSVKQSVYQSVMQAVSHTVSLPISYADNQSNSQSTNQSCRQSVKPRIAYNVFNRDRKLGKIAKLPLIIGGFFELG